MIEFTPWRRFSAYRDQRATQQFLDDYARTGQRELRRQITSGRKSGRVYRRRGGVHQASAPGEFPANMRGRLARSVQTRVSAHDASFGATVFYAAFLADGTVKMAKRAMSKEAHQIIISQVRARMPRWVYWIRN